MANVCLSLAHIAGCGLVLLSTIVLGCRALPTRAADPAASPAAGVVDIAGRRPNVIYIVCHDLGRTLGAYGDKSVKSPCLDRLAASGVVFTNYFCSSSPCTPSRGCAMTSSYAHENGLMGLEHRGWSYRQGQRTVAHELADAGYRTQLMGFQHEGHDAAELGYQEAWTKSTDAGKVAEQVAEFLAAQNPGGKPFYLNAGFFQVHRPYLKGGLQPADPAAVAVPGYLPDTPEVRRDVADFHASIAYMDAAVGRIVEALDKSAVKDDTVLIFTTDHGEANPRAKGTLRDPGLGVALVMRVPGVRGGVRRAELLTNLDVAPTVLAMAGVAPPPYMRGRSFLPLVAGGEYRKREEIFAEINCHSYFDPMRCVRTERYKYIRYWRRDVPAVSLPSDVKKEGLGAILGAAELAPRRDLEELFDLRADTAESRNLAADPACAAVLADLRGRLEAWMRETDDPLLGAADAKKAIALPAKQPMDPQ